MNYSFEYIDIILLAMIAGFIFLRLRGILGKRTGFEGKLREEGKFQDYEKFKTNVFMLLNPKTVAQPEPVTAEQELQSLVNAGKEMGMSTETSEDIDAIKRELRMTSDSGGGGGGGGGGGKKKKGKKKKR